MNTTRNSGKEYAHVSSEVDADEPLLVEAVAVRTPHTVAAATAAAAVEYVELRAPVALPSGYELAVTVDGSHWTVGVPHGGASEGEIFRAEVLQKSKVSVAGAHHDRDENPHHIPRGHFRDGIFDCCTHGCCHPLCCLSYWCLPLALGQVMTRMNLTPCGAPAAARDSPSSQWSPFAVMAVLLVALLAIDQGIGSAISPYLNAQGENGQISPQITSFLAVQQGLRLAFGLYVLIAACKTRAFIRRTHGIRESCRSGCDDCCCAFWCACCVVSQMARHTADYSTYSASCCSDTGLGERAPPAVSPHIV